jgi:TetR/AcrR family transcriptional regulator, regulator of biofilm formation and stress response
MRQLDGCARDPDPIAALARVIAESNDSRRAHAAAEYELFLIAARRPELQPEVERWTAAMDAYLAPHVADPVRRAAAAAAVDGLFLRCFVAAHPPSADEVRAVLASILGC